MVSTVVNKISIWFYAMPSVKRSVVTVNAGKGQKKKKKKGKISRNRVYKNLYRGVNIRAIKFHELRCFRMRDERLFALHNTFQERNLELVVKKKKEKDVRGIWISEKRYWNVVNNSVFPFSCIIYKRSRVKTSLVRLSTCRYIHQCLWSREKRIYIQSGKKDFFTQYLWLYCIVSQ